MYFFCHMDAGEKFSSRVSVLEHNGACHVWEVAVHTLLAGVILGRCAMSSVQAQGENVQQNVPFFSLQIFLVFAFCRFFETDFPHICI